MRDADIREFAEACIHSVNDRIALNDLFDRFSRGKNTGPRDRRNVNGLASKSDRCKLNERNLLALQLHLRSLVEIPEKEKGQAESTTWPLGRNRPD
jgi:hypothetical protein